MILLDAIVIFHLTPFLRFDLLTALVLHGLGVRFVVTLFFSSSTLLSMWSLSIFLFIKFILLALRYQRQRSNRQKHILTLRISRLRSKLQSLLDSMISPSFSTRARNEELIADSHDHATVLFVTVVSSPGAALDAAQSLARIDSLSRRFDSLVISRRMLKVEHVGNDYVVVSPFFDLPPAPDLTAADTARHGGDSDMCHCHSATLALLATEMAAAGRDELAGSGLELRIGLAAGAVTAAVIGRSRRYLRVLGDTVQPRPICIHACIHVYMYTYRYG
jgi:class 3 adenylate cyclase